MQLFVVLKPTARAARDCVADISPLLPPTPMSRRAAGGAGRGAEFGAGLAGVGWLEDFASAARSRVIGRRFALARAAGAVGQGFRAVHFVEMGFVDF